MRRDGASASPLSGFASAKLPGAKRFVAEKEVVVNVLQDTDVFELFLSEAYSSLETRWHAVQGNQDPMPFTESEYIKYGYTAVKARVSRVNNERFHTRCDDPWALNPLLAAVLASVGLVESETPVMTIKPKWLAVNDVHVLSRDEQADVTRRIRSLELVDNLGFVSIRAIAGDRTGVSEVMRIIPLRAPDGRIVQLASSYDVDSIAAVAYLLGGLCPELWDGMALPTHPQFIPAYFYEAIELVFQLRYRMSEVGYGKNVPKD